MDYYYSAKDDAAALKAMSLPGGPVPGSGMFESVEAKDIIACPHLELLVSRAAGHIAPSLVPALHVLWPEPQSGQLIDEPSASIMRLPEILRDGLAAVEMTPALAASWAEELWGFEADHAGLVGTRLIKLARSAREQGMPIYWWSEA